jgi:hypothetical protein
MRLRAELAAVAGRARRAAQVIIAEVGADGPMNVDEAAERIVARLAAAEAERDRLQRACDEGLPREVILCPGCGEKHVEGPRHDNPALDGRTRPHHTHRCYGCGHIWDSGRWSFGVEQSTGIAAERDEALRTIAQTRTELAAAREALVDINRGDAPFCEECGNGETLATQYDDGGNPVCDAHSEGIVERRDLPYAAALRVALELPTPKRLHPAAVAEDAAVEAVDAYSTDVWHALGHTSEDDPGADSVQTLRAVWDMRAERDETLHTIAQTRAELAAARREAQTLREQHDALRDAVKAYLNAYNERNGVLETSHVVPTLARIVREQTTRESLRELVEEQ